MPEEKKKKGLFGAIKESMNKTGGCNCGPGDACYVTPEEEKETPEPPPPSEKCCGGGQHDTCK
jgi:hypothetical protein